MGARHFGSTEKEAFIIEDKGVLLGKVETATPTTEITDLDNSNINEDFCGKGIENQLVNAEILHARKTIAHPPAPCSFTRTRFANDHDVIID